MHLQEIEFKKAEDILNNVKEFMDDDSEEVDEHICENYEYEREPDNDDYAEYLASKGMKSSEIERKLDDDCYLASLEQDDKFHEWLKNRYEGSAYDEWLNGLN